MKKKSIFLFLAVSAFLAGTAPAEQRAARLVYCGGSVEARKAGESFTEAAPGAIFGKGDSLRTGAGSLAEFELDDGSVIKMGGKTVISVISLDKIGPGKDKISIFSLGTGEIKLAVRKLRGQNSGFEVQTRSCIVSTPGSEFSVSSEGAEASNIDVNAGSVFVGGISKNGEPGSPVELKAGNGTRVENGMPPMKAVKSDRLNAMRWQLWAGQKKVFTLKKELRKEELARAEKDLASAAGRFYSETAKAAEQWKKTLPAQRAAARMNYDIWTAISDDRSGN